MRPMILWLALCLCGGALFGEDAAVAKLTSVQQLRHVGRADAWANHEVRIEGLVLWTRPAAGELVLQDATGAALLEMDLRGQTLRAGQRVRITGNGTAAQEGAGVRLGVIGAVVDNDGVHSMQQKSGAAWLEAGRHPLRLDWFNGTAEYGLEVEYSGPDLQRQKIPDGVLFRVATEPPERLVAGLDWECFEVPGELLPGDESRVVLSRGVTNNFNLNLAGRPDHVGLSFKGYINVAQSGLYTFFLRSDDGSRLVVDAPSVRLEVLGESPLPTPEPVALGQLLNDKCEWAQVSGTVAFVTEAGGELGMELRSGTGRIRVEVTDSSGLRAVELNGKHVRATGVCVCANTADAQEIAGRLLAADRGAIELIESNRPAGGTNELPFLTTAAEVHRLNRDEAQRQYPVDIQGVVTCVLPDQQAFTVQDTTRGLYAADMCVERSHLPEIGTFLEIKGTTDPGKFAPVVNAVELTELGAGQLPEPVRPTWDQLVNGSLDAQYVELQGIVTAVNTNGITLLTREGRINVELRVLGVRSAELERFENALVRVRGCLFANWDYVTHEVKAGEVRVYGAAISMEQPAPEDPFATEKKSFGELLLFDPQASVFKRVKVSGQVLHTRDMEFFMTDGKSGLRFVVNKRAELAPGDLAEVVGFPELGGVSPLLREATVRKTGHASMPPVRGVSQDNLIDAKLDGTWVQVRGSLVSVRETPSEQLLELQGGLRTFVARLPGSGKFAPSLPGGCLLELNGVYSGQGGNKAVGQEINSFELLLNGSSDIRVLARPPWWTLERLLVIVGTLACVLAFTVLWITQLHRKVESRTAELEIQIKERQRVEQQRLMEQERARVSQDLHDELGSGLTEISMLAARSLAVTATDEKRKSYLDQMNGKAREIVGVLDEIVWAMNPRHDSISSLVSYFGLYADHFLGLAGIGWRLEDSTVAQEWTVDSRCRHQLFLAFKEALTNVVRHAQATEVKLRIGLEQGEVRLTITDNGRGLPEGQRTEHMDGVANMRNRVEKLGGRFEMASVPGGGTTVSFHVPANKNL